MKFRDQKGFTLIELIIVVMIVVIVVGFGVIGGLGIKGNYWYTEAGVLADLQVDRPEMTRVLRSNRNVASYSTFVIEDDEGTRTTFELDTNILFNYAIAEVDD